MLGLRLVGDKQGHEGGSAAKLVPSHPPASQRRPRGEAVSLSFPALEGGRVSPETNQEGPPLGGLYKSLTPTQTLPAQTTEGPHFPGRTLPGPLDTGPRLRER